tara:strand:+ start:198 stop:494 length:297 start_codon:yes stop_codon:yes gene_type:complete
MAQKLSPKAAKAKAARDLAFAKTPARRAKKADSQKRHRDNPSMKGKDYDHKDGKFKSVKANRGNDGQGTKKEGKRKFSVKSMKTTSKSKNKSTRYKKK